MTTTKIKVTEYMGLTTNSRMQFCWLMPNNTIALNRKLCISTSLPLSYLNTNKLPQPYWTSLSYLHCVHQDLMSRWKTWSWIFLRTSSTKRNMKEEMFLFSICWKNSFPPSHFYHHFSEFWDNPLQISLNLKKCRWSLRSHMSSSIYRLNPRLNPLGKSIKTQTKKK